ncbi:MAG: DegT/DnrJ/EryC1/StrS family aminotransferase, partial [Myxococcota bacterium]
VRRSSSSKPEVLLPAYGCPALVAASLNAGATPVVVDTQWERPWQELGAVSDALNENTVALVAVNLLGIPERLGELRARIGERVLIEDSAQALPSPGERGDLTVLSFGRGKPLSVLGGGAVLSYSEEFSPESLPVNHSSALRYRLKISAYNVLAHPLAYGMLTRLPGLRIGETRFEALEELEGMSQAAVERLAPNLERFNARAWRSAHRRLADAVRAAPGVLDLAECCGSPDRMLRYPILARDGEHAIRLRRTLRALGATGFYEVALPDVKGVDDRVRVAGSVENARNFAARLVTLPTHEDVSDSNYRAIEKALGA